jgi:hypothetical protein
VKANEPALLRRHATGSRAGMRNNIPTVSSARDCLINYSPRFREYG